MSGIVEKQLNVRLHNLIYSAGHEKNQFMQAEVYMLKKIIYKGFFYKQILHSKKIKNLMEDHFLHTFDVFFARPAVVVGISGIFGGSLGFSFNYAGVVTGFILLHVFILLLVIIKESDSAKLLTRIPIICLALVLGLYCMSLISYQRNKAANALLFEQTRETGSNDSVYEGYIVSVSLPDETYKTYTLFWKDGIKIRFGSSRTDLVFGQHVRISGVLSNVPSARNPGGFDEKNYYGRQGIFLSLDTFNNNIYIQNDRSIIPDFFVRLEWMGLKLRENITSMWTQVLDQDAAALLSGMILGDTSAMSPELKSAFRMCNLAHLTAVSGANVAYFLVPVTAFFQKLSGRRAVRHLLVFLFLVFFGFLTGWTSSVTRAIFMSAGTIFSSALMKRHDPVSAMFLTAAILVFNNPYVAVDLGFLLSFSATLSLVLFSGKMTKSLLSFFNKTTKRIKKIPGKEIITQAAACLICTQLGMLPWLIVLSGKQSVLLFFTNLAGSFLSEGISLLCLPLSGCLLAAKAVPFLLPAVKVLFFPLGGLLYVLAKMAFVCADQSIQALRLYTVQPLLLFSVSTYILSFFIPRGFLSRNLRRIICFFLAAGIVLQIYSYANRPMGVVIFADVGQGDSALILLDNSKSILIDGGDIGSAKNVLIPLLNYYGIREPDITILTHLHRDHGSGILELIEAGRVSSVYTPCTIPNKELSGLFSLEEECRVTLHSIEKGDKIVLSESAVLFVLSPDTISEKGGNEDSAVVLLCIGSTGVLFMGDAGESTENQILAQNQTMNMLSTEADFLKVGHHGSKFSTTQSFLDELSLEAAVISVGENSYGHPTADTLDRLNNENIDVYRTDFSGAVFLEILQNMSRLYEYCAQN